MRLSLISSIIGMTCKFFPLPKPLSCVLANLAFAISLVLHTWIGGETGNRSAHNGSDSSCFLTSKAIKNRYVQSREGKAGSKKRKTNEVSGTGRKDRSVEENSRPTRDCPTGRLSHSAMRPLFSPSVIFLDSKHILLNLEGMQIAISSSIR